MTGACDAGSFDSAACAAAVAGDSSALFAEVSATCTALAEADGASTLWSEWAEVRVTAVADDGAVPDGIAEFNPLKLYTSGTLVCALKGLDPPVPLEIWWDDFAIGSPD